MKNRAAFYDVLRDAEGPLDKSQVEGLELLLDYGLQINTPLHDLAYILATVWWETGRTCQPITEYGSQRYLRGKKYWPYIGRGYVQLTWKENYQKATDYFREVLGLDVDFVRNPDLVKQPQYALVILFEGMNDGWFTGKGLDDYIDDLDEPMKEDLREFSNARRIVNGTDQQVKIGQIALTFEKALKAAGYDPLKLDPAAPSPRAAPRDKKMTAGAALFALILALAPWAEGIINWIRNLI